MLTILPRLNALQKKIRTTADKLVLEISFFNFLERPLNIVALQ